MQKIEIVYRKASAIFSKFFCERYAIVVYLYDLIFVI